MKKIIVFAITLSALWQVAFAAAYVDPSSPGPLHNGRTWKTAYLRISDALAKTSSGDIWVRGGLFRERIKLGKYQNIIGGFAGWETSPANRAPGEKTIIDAELKGRAIDIPNQARCMLDGLVIRNGFADRGAGVRCATNSTVKIRNCFVENCTATDQGGAIYYGMYTCGEVSDCIITNNAAAFGGGIVVEYHSYPVLKRNIIAWNTARNSGGGVYCPFHSGARLENCIIAFNLAGVNGGAVYSFQGGPVILSSSILAFNSASIAGGIFGGGVSSAATVSKCCLWGNAGGDYGGAIRVPPISAKNIYADPLFIDAPNGDFHLSSDSPCIGL